MVEVDLKALLDPRTLVGGGLKLVERFGDEAYFAAVCIRSGMVGPELPHRVAQMLLAFERYGMLAGAVTIGAIRHGDRVAIRDERGDVTYKELDERTNALANAWRDQGLRPGDGVAILVRNHRGFLEAVFAAAKLGAKIILLNTSFAGPQIREVAEREGTDLLVYDDEYAEVLEGVDPPHGRWRAWVEDEAEHPEKVEDSLESLIAGGDTERAAAAPAARPRSSSSPAGPPARPRAPRATSPSRWASSAACSARCPSAPARRPSWPSPCSTRSASPAWCSAWRWARRSSCAATSIPRPRWTASRTTRPPRWSSSR